MEQIGKYAKPHGSGLNSGSGKTVIIQKGNTMTEIPADLNLRSITANVADFHDLTAKSANINDANIVYLMSQDGSISHVHGSSLRYDEGYIGKLTTDEFETNKLSVLDTATIKNLISEYIQSNDIHTDYLTVNKSAHFFELVIDKLRSVQGTQMNTAANCTLDFVEAYASNGDVLDMTDDAFDVNNVEYFRCYWKNQDDNGKVISNEWLPLDQALCETFNVQTGVSHNTGNKYYWRLVNATSNDTGQGTRYINFKTGDIKTEPVEGYKIKFNNDFKFTFDGSSSEDNPAYDFNPGEPLDSFVITNDNQNDTLETEVIQEGGENVSYLYWGVNSVSYGIRLRPGSIETDGTTSEYIPVPVIKGTFTFSLDEEAKLDVAFVFDDNTFEYYPYNPTEHLDENENPKEYDTEYSIHTDNTANITSILILTQEIHTWEECHWIDLSNTDKDADKTGKNSIPEAGDILAQLGYRYNLYQSDDERYKPERASAIIIAAYDTPDSGGKINGKTIKPIVPPSYAQYQNIIDYNLFTHRGTYMDATGAHIVGILEGGTTIGEGVTIPVEVEQYKLIGNTAIYKDNNNNFSPTSITFSILHSTSQATQILDTLPTGFTLEVNGVSQNSLVVNSAQTLSIRLKEGNKIWDGIEIEATSVDALNGQNGEWTEYIYRAYTTDTPNLPTNGIAWNNMSSTQKDSWNKEQPTLSGENTYIWQSWRRITYDSSNNAIYTDNWKSPTRQTGINGEPGRDGNGEENIFKHYQSELTASQLNQAEHNPYNWGGNLSESDVVDLLTTYNWNQSPQGINLSYTYEYISTRRKYLDTDTSSNTYNQMVWSYFSAPKIWAKWGENGQDGDGVKYIFRKYKVIAAGDNYTPTFRGNGYPNISSMYSDTNNNVWYDNSMEPDENGDVYCSQSLKYQTINGNRFWTDFQEPKRWLTYVKDGEDGQTGPQGPSGPQGDDGESYQLLKLSEVFEVTIDKSDTIGNLDNVTGAVNTHFRYMIDKVDGDTHHIMTTTELNNENIQMKLTWDNSVKVSGSEVNRLTYINLVPQTESSTGYGYFEFNKDNLLNEQFYNSYTDYYYLHKNSFTNYMPTKTDVYLVDSGVEYEMENVPLIFKPDHYFKFGDYAFNSLYQGLSGNQNGQFTTTGWSQIHQDWTNVSLGVYNINNVMNGGGYPTSSSTEHYIYKTQSTKPTKPSGSSSTGTSWVAPSGWSKTPTTPDGTYNYCWICNSVRQRTIGGYSSDWTTWSDPQIISSYTGGGVTYTSSVNTAQLDITANQIQSTVSETYETKTNAQSAYSNLSSQITQTATSIKAEVKSDINGDLKTTGIDIENQKITLAADKVTFTNSSGTVTDKINIDPNTGTLHATDGDFNGTVNATTFYSSSYNIPSTVSSIDLGVTGTTIYNQYLKQGQTTSVTDIYLPNPLSYNGLEIKFLCFTTTNPNNFIGDARYCIRIHRPSSGERAALRVRGTSFTAAYFNATQLGQLYIGTRGQTDSTYEQIWLENIAVPMTGADYIDIMPNTLCTMKSISGRWYQITGANEGLASLAID